MDVVYAMRDANGLIKIGFTGNLPKRVATVQSRRGARVEVLWSTPGGSYLEFRLHREFAKYWIANEWFDFGGLEPIALISAAVERLRPPGYGSTTRSEVLPQLHKIRKTRTTRGDVPRMPIQLALDAGMRISEIAREAGCSTTVVRNIRRDKHGIAPDPRYAHLRPPTKESTT